MRKIFTSFVMILALVIGVAAQGDYKINKTVDLRDGFEAKYITHADAKDSVLIRFPEQYLINGDKFAEGFQIALEKVFGSEFCKDCVVKYETVQHEKYGTVMMFSSKTWRLLVMTIVNNLTERRTVGVEVYSKKL